MLIIAEREDGKQYEPIGEAVSIPEAREIAASDMRNRMRDIGERRAPMCPYWYVIWDRDINGPYMRRNVIRPESLNRCEVLNA